MSSEFDIIIIGGGTAGCVLAHRLSARQDLRILVLEAGADHSTDPNVSIPLLSRQMFNDPVYDWQYCTTPQKDLNNRIIQQTRGRMLGGSSAINSNSLVYPSQSMHEAWSQIAGNGQWSWESVKHCYERFQTVQGRSAEDSTSTSGPVQASYPKELHPLQKVWEEAFRSLGWFSDRPGYLCDAVGGVTTTNAIDGLRGERSQATAYLKSSTDNLVVMTDATVTRVLFNENKDDTSRKLRAVGVVFEKEGQQKTVHATREVILSAGTFGSPQLLELSGIGRQDILHKAGVQCHLDLAGVGENLQDHLNYGPSIEVHPSIETGDVAARDPKAAAARLEEYQKHHTGPLSEGAAYSFAYWPLQLFNTAAEEIDLRQLLERDWGIESGTTLYSQYEFCRRMILDPDEASATVFMTRMQRYTRPGHAAPGNYMTIIAMLSHPFSRGHCHIESKDARRHPRIDCSYLSHPLDAEILARHVLQIERLLDEPKLKAVLRPGGKRLPMEYDTRPQTVEEIKEAIMKYSATNYHPCGTCAMLPISSGGVVDGDLRVYGTENLRVCDASVFPIIPRGNILSTVYAVAERGAEIILSSSK
ncbi:putative Choline dehydrogenase [Seiridium cardinale]